MRCELTTGVPWLLLLICGLPFPTAPQSLQTQPSIPPCGLQTQTAQPAQDPPVYDTSRVGLKELWASLQAKRWDDAEKLLSALLAQSPNDPTILFWAGYVRLHKKRPLEAIPLLRSAERREPHLPHLAKTLAACYYAIHQYSLFEQKISKAILAAPKDPEPYFSLGVYQTFIRGDFPQAIHSFDQALRLRALDVRALSYQGYAHEMLRQEARARERYVQSIAILEKERLQGFSLPYVGMARILVDATPEDALRYGLKALEHEPRIAENQSIVGKIYVTLGRFSDAVAAYEKARELDPTASEPRYALYQLYQKIGEREKAIRALGEFRRIQSLYH